MLPLLKDVNPPVDLDSIERFEVDENIVLPQDYKDFLLEYNGGHVDDICFVEYGPWESSIDRFLGLSENNNEWSLQFVRKNLKSVISLPDHLLCIAANASDHELVVLIVRGRGIGYVYAWRIEYDPPYKYLISKTFSRFLRKLQTDEE